MSGSQSAGFTRRRLLGTAVATALALRAGAAPAAARRASRRPFGIQMWTVREEAERDLAGTLAALAKMGYSEVESYSFDARPIQSNRFAGYAPEDFAKALQRAGLRCPSVHVALGGKDVDAVVHAAKAVGARFAVSSILRRGTGQAPYDGPPRAGYLAPMNAMTRADAHETARLANEVGAALKRAGLQYCYHNHYFEFAALDDGECGYDVLWRETDPDLVKFEIDCGWMMVAGYDPVKYMRRDPARVPMLHIKDFLPAAAGQTEGLTGALRLGSELGRGALDYSAVFAALPDSAVEHTFAEQEGPFTRMKPLDAAREGMAFLRQGAR